MLLLVFTLLFTQASCKSVSFNTSNFQEVDFSGGQKLHLVEGGDVYNLFISFSESDGLNIKYLPEASEILLDTSVNIKGELVKFASSDLTLTKNINNFDNNFTPKLLYLFFKNTDFSKEEFVFQKEENSMTLSKTILEKNLVFTVQLTEEKDEQFYKLEIR